MNTLLYIFGILLIGAILLQAPKQESLGNAFSTTHKTRAEKILTRATYFFFIGICFCLLIIAI